MRFNPFYDFLAASGQGLVSFFSASGFVLELLLSVILFTWKIKRKKGWDWKGLLCLAALLAIGKFWATYVPANAATTIVRCLVFYAGLFFTMWVCLESDVRHLLLYLVAGVTAQHFIYCGAQVTTYGLVKLIGPAGETSWLSLVLYPLCLIPFFVLAYLLFARRIAWQSLDVVIGARILALIIGVFLCVTIFASLYNGSTTGEQVSPLIFVTFIMTRMITCGFLLELMTEIGDRFATIHESAVLQQLLNEQKNKLAADKETIELINVKTHDLKKQLNLLGGKIPDDQIQDLGRLVSFYDSSIHSGNEALDVLLTNKSLICTERSIQLERMIDGVQAFLHEAPRHLLPFRKRLGQRNRSRLQDLRPLPPLHPHDRPGRQGDGHLPYREPLRRGAHLPGQQQSDRARPVDQLPCRPRPSGEAGPAHQQGRQALPRFRGPIHPFGGPAIQGLGNYQCP